MANTDNQHLSTASRYQVWTMDGQGNRSSLNTDGASVSRTHDKQNEVTAVGAASLTYDSNGNLKTDQNGQQYVYDAWNRLVTVKNSGGSTIASYKYDGLSHRIQQTVSATTTDFYFSSGWQVLEERVGGTAKVQYVWSPVYVDALVERDRDADGNAGNGLEERFYVQQDANFNVTAIINTSGTVVERYVYDPYGAPTFLSAGWIGPADGYSWRILHQGGKFEMVTGLSNFGYRDTHVTLGRWLRADPLGFGAGDTNLYRYEGNTPSNVVDPSGLQRRDLVWDPPRRDVSELGPLPPFNGLADGSPNERPLTDAEIQLLRDEGVIPRFTSRGRLVVNSMGWILNRPILAGPEILAGLYGPFRPSQASLDRRYFVAMYPIRPSAEDVAEAEFHQAGAHLMDVGIFAFGMALSLEGRVSSAFLRSAGRCARGATSRFTQATTPWQRRVYQRADIDWDLVRPDGTALAGQTNRAAARQGYTPVRINPEGGIDGRVLPSLHSREAQPFAE